MSKAFDTIDHKTLLAKLRSYGVRGIAHSLIESYLSNRKQYVSVLGENSDLADVIYGVPQGSCLGPLLFLIYINDISNTSNEGEFILFADDTNIFVRGQTALLAFKTANKILRKVNDYMYVNKLHINMEKCCFIHFKLGNTNKENTVTAEFDVKIGDEIIKQVSETKFLGITIDNKLSWDTHINKLSKNGMCYWYS